MAYLKSIMGIFSLDLSKLINLNIHGDKMNAEIMVTQNITIFYS